MEKLCVPRETGAKAVFFCLSLAPSQSPFKHNWGHELWASGSPLCPYTCSLTNLILICVELQFYSFSHEQPQSQFEKQWEYKSRGSSDEGKEISRAPSERTIHVWSSVVVPGAYVNGARVCQLLGVNSAPVYHHMSVCKCTFKNSVRTCTATWFPKVIHDF